MIINLRGTSGSGKTTAVRYVMQESVAYGPAQRVHAVGKRVRAYQLPLPTGRAFVLGSYETTCGGCDTISDHDELCELVRYYAGYGHVVFEGLIVSHIFQRYADLARELRPVPYIWALLNTPLEMCLQRVQQRRADRGVTVPLNPRNTIMMYQDVLGIARKCTAAGLDVRWVDHTCAGETVWKWLLNGG